MNMSHASLHISKIGIRTPILQMSKLRLLKIMQFS